MNNNINIAILGAGAAGLGVGYYATQLGKRITIFEADSRVGGMCQTYSFSDFYYDQGAHRLHGKIASVIHEIMNIMGPQLSAIDLPSQIYMNGSFVDFPLSPFNLSRFLGFADTLNAAGQFLKARLKKENKFSNFESYAVFQYGKRIAELFLLNYSQKLWGLPCYQLSPHISGKRLEGLSLSSFIIESLTSSRTKTRHLDGMFYYPDRGFGQITETLAARIGSQSIKLNNRVTRLYHNGVRIHSIEINNSKKVDAKTIISTLPLPNLVHLLTPSPPSQVLNMARQLRYQSLILVVFFINRASITNSGTMYFPDHRFPFTRISEPKNRSAYMAPPDQTSLLIEIPCDQNRTYANKETHEMVIDIQNHLYKLGWVDPESIIDVRVHRLDYAYPLLKLGYENKVEHINRYLQRFENLILTGRSSLFQYIHFHDVMDKGRQIAQTL